MISELDVLRIVSERLDAAQIPYMLTGSYALAFYTTPRMTRDLDLVISVDKDDVGAIVKVFESDFYVDIDDVRSAVLSPSQFNLMHLKSGIKVDLIVRKAAEYRQVEFARRRETVDRAYVEQWAKRLGVDGLLRKIADE